ncbi:3-isopropylmalate dehydratase small subunit domain protein, partial [Vibrio parahaemolyticus V-223/04]
SFLR